MKNLLGITLLSISALLTGCGGSGGGSEGGVIDSGGSEGGVIVKGNSLVQGQIDPVTGLEAFDDVNAAFIDSVVANLMYERSGFSGVYTTSVNGTVYCDAGETVTFFVGKINLGSSPCQKLFTPQSLTSGLPEEDYRVLNRVKLLMVMDTDGDASNGITLPEQKEQENLTTTVSGLDFNSKTFDVDASTLTSNLGKNMPEDRVALEHYRGSLDGVIATYYPYYHRNTGTYIEPVLNSSDAPYYGRDKYASHSPDDRPLISEDNNQSEILTAYQNSGSNGAVGSTGSSTYEDYVSNNGYQTGDNATLENNIAASNGYNQSKADELGLGSAYASYLQNYYGN